MELCCFGISQAFKDVNFARMLLELMPIMAARLGSTIERQGTVQSMDENTNVSATRPV